MRLKFLFLIFCLGTLQACQALPRRTPEIQYPSELAEVLHMIDEGDRQTALKYVDQYLGRAEKLQWYGHAFYLQGRIHQGAQNYKEAIESFRRAIRHSSEYDSQVEAQSLYALAETYEQSGQFTHLLSALLDLRRRGKHFSSLVEDVEIPARLAAAYAQAGQMDVAAQWHESGAKNLQQTLRAQGPLLSGDDIARSHYYLGLAVFPVKNETFDQLLYESKLILNKVIHYLPPDVV